MNKKLLLSIVLLTGLIFSFNCVFANNMVNDAANTVNDSMNKTGNTVENAGNALRDAGNGAMNAVNDVVDGTMNTVNELTQDRPTNDNNDHTSNMQNTANTNNYTATRTANEGTMLGMNATAWTWIIMGIVAIAIVALIWYYSMQTNTIDRNYDE